MRRRLSISLLLVGVIALAVMAFVVTRGNDTSSQQHEFTVGDTRVTVEADVTAGKIVGSPAEGEAPNVPGVKPLADPIHLEVKGGSLKEATLTFPVDTNAVPDGVEPEEAFDVLTRSEQTSNQWVWAGPGEYDPETKTLSVQVEHFSDWTYGVTDFDAIAHEAERRRDQDGLGFRLGRGVYGDIPLLTCPDNEVPLSYGISTEVNLPVAVCITFSPSEKRYRVEVVNNTPLPFGLTLPEGLTAIPGELTGTGTFGEIFAQTYASRSEKEILRPEGKRVFVGKEGEFRPGSIINVDFDERTYLGDMGAFAADLTLMPMGDYDPYMQVPTGAHSRPLPFEIRKAMEGREFADCLTKEANRLEDALRSGELDEQDEIYQASANCYSQTVGQALDLVEQVVGRKGLLGRATRWFSKRAEIILNLPQILGQVREEIAGLITLWGEFRIDAGADIMLIPEPPWQQMHQALPRPPANQPDDREVIPVQRWLLMPDGCGDNFSYDWFTYYPNMGSTAAVAVSSYYQGPYQVHVSLMQVQDDHTVAARGYMESLPRECEGRYGLGGPTIRNVLQSDDVAGDISRFYLTHSDTAGPADGYTFIALSGRYIIMVTVDVTEPLTPEHQEGAMLEAKNVFRHLDWFLPTDFLR